MPTKKLPFAKVENRTLAVKAPASIAISPVNVTEMGLLAQWGFTAEEITSLLWLRQWYQDGGSDRATIVRYLEFLRLLVRSGELEL